MKKLLISVRKAIPKFCIITYAASLFIAVIILCAMNLIVPTILALLFLLFNICVWTEYL